MFGQAIRSGRRYAPAAAAAVGLTQADDADAGLLYQGMRGARKAVEKYQELYPDFRPPIVAEKAPDQFMIDPKTGKPRPGTGGREFMGKGKGTEYMPIAADRAGRQMQIIESYVDLEKRLNAVGNGKNDWRKRRNALNHFMHQQNDYERWSPIVRDTYDKGHASGDTWKMGMDAKYEEMLEMVPKRYHNDVKSYFHDHIVKRDKAPEPHGRYNPNKRNPALNPVPVAAVAAAGAGGANAEDQTFDEYLSEMERNAPLPVPTGGDILDSVFDVLDMPMEGLQMIGRGLFGLATGEDPTQALAEGVHVAEQGPEYGAERLGNFVEEKTGDNVLGDWAKWGLLLGSPF